MTCMNSSYLRNTSHALGYIAPRIVKAKPAAKKPLRCASTLNRSSALS